MKIIFVDDQAFIDGFPSEGYVFLHIMITILYYTKHLGPSKKKINTSNKTDVLIFQQILFTIILGRQLLFANSIAENECRLSCH